MQRKGKGKEVVAEKEAKSPRTTHKLLQVPLSCLCSNYALILIFMKDE